MQGECGAGVIEMTDQAIQRLMDLEVQRDEARERVSTLEAAISVARARVPLRPMSGAPKDGTQVEVVFLISVSWSKGFGAWTDGAELFHRGLGWIPK